MSLNPIKWLDWLVTEHWSSGILRERLGQSRDRIETLERQLKEQAVKHEEDILTLKRRHAKEVAELKAAHDEEMRRLTHLYATGKGILIPKGILEDEQQKKNHT
jgi:hypothetical protein